MVIMIIFSGNAQVQGQIDPFARNQVDIGQPVGNSLMTLASMRATFSWRQDSNLAGNPRSIGKIGVLPPR
jgi:hypothetical protein